MFHLARLVVVLALLIPTVGQPAPLRPLLAATVDRLPSGPVEGPIRFEARLASEGGPGTVVTTPTGRYADTIEVRRAPVSDLITVNELSFEQYVAGIAEMPARWPLEALKAQAVAARTYGWFEVEQGAWQNRGLGYDVCDSTSCQVFRGLAVVETPEVGQRWQQAVDETAGEVLVSGGEPILARYFSTSGGLRWANDVIFPSSGSYPYLVGGPDPDDAASPLHTWSVRFTAEQFQELLSRGSTLSAAVPYARVRTIPSTTPGLTRAVEVTGQDGTTVEVGSVAFRSFVSAVAPDLWPDEYPGLRDDGEARLPTAMPSSRFTFDVVAGQDVVIDGRGWGHGVGMGQWGAFGKAERGLTHDEILASYYNGLRPTTSAALPDRVRVGLDADAGPVEVFLDGPARLVVAGTPVADRALGTWQVRRGPARSLELAAPEGFGEVVEVADTTTSRARPSPVEVVTITTQINQPVELRMDVVDPQADAVLTSFDLGVREAGRHELRWSLDDADGARLPSGTYQVVMVGVGHDGRDAGVPTTVEVRPFTSGEDTDLPPTLRRPVPATAVTGVVGVAVPLGAVALAGALLGTVAGALATRPRRTRP